MSSSSSPLNGSSGESTAGSYWAHPSMGVLASTHIAMARRGLAFSSSIASPIASRCMPMKCSRRRVRCSLGVSSFAHNVLSSGTKSKRVQSVPPIANTRMVLAKISNATTSLFPVWTVICSWLALKYPASFVPLTSPTLVQTALSLLMLSTGMTLTPAQIRVSTARTRLILLSLFGCYVLMPALAVLLSRLCSLPPALHAGLVLLGIISGGQASNLCTLIAGGDVALSVTMTTASTVLSAVALPSLSAMLLSQVLYVKPLAMAKSVSTLVLLPVLVGAAISATFKESINKVKPVLPVVGIAAVLVLILGPVSKSASLVQQGFGQLALPVTLLHVLGGAVGFGATLAMGGARKEALTVAFETGFKSPALSFVLAQRHFGDALVALPSVVSIVLLAPVAAACAVLLRAAGSGGGGGGDEHERHSQPPPVTWPVAAATAAPRAETREHKLFCVRVAGGRTKTVPFAALSSEVARARRRAARVSVWRLGQPPPPDADADADADADKPRHAPRHVDDDQRAAADSGA